MNIEERVQKEDVVDKSFTRLKKYKILRGGGLVGLGGGGGGKAGSRTRHMAVAQKGNRKQFSVLISRIKLV